MGPLAELETWIYSVPKRKIMKNPWQGHLQPWKLYTLLSTKRAFKWYFQIFKAPRESHQRQLIYNLTIKKFENKICDPNFQIIRRKFYTDVSRVMKISYFSTHLNSFQMNLTPCLWAPQFRGPNLLEPNWKIQLRRRIFRLKIFLKKSGLWELRATMPNEAGSERGKYDISPQVEFSPPS